MYVRFQESRGIGSFTKMVLEREKDKGNFSKCNVTS